MYKALAVLRTVFLVFIAGYTIRAMPSFLSPIAATFDEQYARCSTSLALMTRAAWYAVAWIALEAVAGWLLVRRRVPAATATAQASPGEGRPAEPR